MSMIKILEPTVQLRVLRHNSAHFNCKIVFSGLRDFLKSSGYEVTSVASSLGGRGTEIAVRLKISPLRDFSEDLRLKVEILPNPEPSKRFNRFISFPTLEQVLESSGIEVMCREKTVDGRNSPIAVRAKIA